MNLFSGFVGSVQKGLLIIILLILATPFCASRLLDLHEKPLAGISEPIPDSLSWKSWNSSLFQQSTEKLLDYHAGFRNSMVRFHNQIDYSLFGVSTSSSVVMGVNGQLFESLYISAFSGKDYQGVKAISEQVDRLVRIHRYLASYGIDLLIVFAPSKARVYPEYLRTYTPESYPAPSNYLEYTHQLRSFPFLHFIDFNKAFLELKDTSGISLFPKSGIHWTRFMSQTYVVDSLFTYIEYLRGITIPKFHLSAVVYTDTLKTPDNDLYELLNLIHDQSGERLPYPVFDPDPGRPEVPVRILTIGDSFFYTIYANPPWIFLFHEDDFWFSGGKRLPTPKYKNFRDTSFRSIREDIMAHDVVIVLLTEMNLRTFMHFPENGMAWLGLEGEYDLHAREMRENRIDHFINLIHHSEPWLKQIRKKAEARKITLEEMIRIDAVFMVEQEEIKKWK